MSRGKHKTNGSGQQSGVSVAERAFHGPDDSEQGLAHRSPPEPAGWPGDPFPMVRRIAEELDRVFEGFGIGSTFGSHWPTASQGGMGAWAPPVEVLRRGDRLVIRAELPGLARDDIHVEVSDDMLSIRGERHRKHEENQEGYFRSERSYGSFFRTIQLPKGVEADKANASFRDGVLEVTIPAPPRKEVRRRRLELND